MHIKPVRVGNQVGNDWLIEKGLEPGERVIAEGTQKIKEGTVVDPQPYQAQMTNNTAHMTRE
jgi:membrane fusion protein (multidrug efflux system)